MSPPPSRTNQRKERQEKTTQKNCAAPARPVARLTGGAEGMCWISPSPASNRRYRVPCWSEVGKVGVSLPKKKDRISTNIQRYILDAEPFLLFFLSSFIFHIGTLQSNAKLCTYSIISLSKGWKKKVVMQKSSYEDSCLCIPLCICMFRVGGGLPRSSQCLCEANRFSRGSS